MGKEDPRVTRTKRAFETALLSLLDGKSYDKITVSNIAQVAGLNRATFYLHYSDKEDLLEQYLTRSLNELDESTKIIQTEFRYDSNYAHPLFIRMFEHIESNYQFYKIMLANQENRQIFYSVKQIIANFVKEANERMQQDRVALIVPTEVSSTYITSAYLGTLIWWIEKGMPYPPEFMARQLTIISTVGPYKDNPFINKQGIGS